ncbi:TrmH family RNA methyltransferase [Caldithrix abyssi]
MIKKISKNRLKFFRQLQKKKYRQEHGLYVVSGLRAVQEALSAAEIAIESVLIDEAQLHLMNELPRTIDKEVLTLSGDEFRQLVEEKTPQGIALVVKKPHFSLDVRRLPQALLYLEEINDPGNLGTLMRSAAWFGWQAILLSKNSVDPYAPKTVRASAGTIAHLQIYENVGAAELEQLKKAGRYRLIAASAHTGQELTTFTLNSRTKRIVALGSEAHGLSKRILTLSDWQVNIKRPGKGESLNLAMAGTIFLYHFTLISSLDFKGAGKHE